MLHHRVIRRVLGGKIEREESANIVFKGYDSKVDHEQRKEETELNLAL